MLAIPRHGARVLDKNTTTLLNNKPQEKLRPRQAAAGRARTPSQQQHAFAATATRHRSTATASS